ncbi:MAG: acyl-CoA thioesterase [Acidimicrobiia bacterium]
MVAGRGHPGVAGCQHERVTKALDGLVDLLDLEPIEVNLFRGVSPQDFRQRVFGGQVAGQALVAAGRTVEPDRRVHSLHAYFLRPGDPAVPIVYDVDRIRDGRSFTTRRVVAIQRGRAIFNLAASFHADEAGFEHQAAMPDVPPPESLAAPPPAGDSPIDVRRVPHGPRAWIRADGELPDDQLLHACVVAYASDLTLLDTILSLHGLSIGDHPGVMLASLDHAMWFHRPFRADDWLLYDQDSPAAAGARGLARGSIFTRTGDLVVSVVQEGLVRPLR